MRQPALFLVSALCSQMLLAEPAMQASASIQQSAQGYQGNLMLNQAAGDAQQQANARAIAIGRQAGAETQVRQYNQQNADPAAIDAVEGFWIPRAWSNSESCAPQMTYSEPVTPTPPTAQSIGLAQLFPAGGSRLSRHAERPYQFTRKVPAGDTAMLAMSYRLTLEGRITGFDKDTALRCAMETPDHQPVCLFAVTFERVTFRDANDQQIATWTD